MLSSSSGSALPLIAEHEIRGGLAHSVIIKTTWFFFTWIKPGRCVWVISEPLSRGRQFFGLKRRSCHRKRGDGNHMYNRICASGALPYPQFHLFVLFLRVSSGRRVPDYPSRWGCQSQNRYHLDLSIVVRVCWVLRLIKTFNSRRFIR